MNNNINILNLLDNDNRNSLALKFTILKVFIKYLINKIKIIFIALFE